MTANNVDQVSIQLLGSAGTAGVYLEKYRYLKVCKKNATMAPCTSLYSNRSMQKDFTAMVIAMLLSAGAWSQTTPMVITATPGATVPVNNQGTNTSISRNTHTFTWKDAAGLQRSALMVDQSANAADFYASLPIKRVV